MTEDKKAKEPLTVDLTEDEYVEASVLASRFAGSLRALPALLAAAVVALAAGLSTMNWFWITYRSIAFPLFLCLCGALLLLYGLWLEPRRVQRRAREDFAVHHALMAGAEVSLRADDLVTVTPKATLTDPYALLPLCVETKTLFVLIKDRERMLTIPKRCFPKDGGEERMNELRRVFTRKRWTMRNWIF